MSRPSGNDPAACPDQTPDAPERIAEAGPRIAAVVVNWNLPAMTRACVRSLQASRLPFRSIVVVDNGSTDHSAETLRADLPTVDVVALGENRGFAGGNNVGIVRALAEGAEWVLLINNDAELAPDALDRLVLAAGPATGLLTPRIDALPSGRLWHAGARTSPLLRLPREVGESDLRTNRPLVVDYAVGCVLLVRRAVFESIGLLDERYFMYYEDLDFSTRARRAGFEIVAVPTARAWHHVGQSLKNDRAERAYLLARHRVLWCRSQPLGVDALAWWLSLELALARDLARAALRGDRRWIRATLRGLRAGFGRAGR